MKKVLVVMAMIVAACGAKWQSVSKTESDNVTTDPGVCASGEATLSISGLDTNGDGELTDEEISDIVIACSGSNVTIVIVDLEDDASGDVILKDPKGKKYKYHGNKKKRHISRCED